MHSTKTVIPFLVALSLGLAACSDDVTPIDTDTTTGGSSSSGSTSNQTTVVPTTEGPTTGTTTDATTGTTTDLTTGTTTDATTDASSSTGVVLPACDDAILNQDETDVDCGGLTCSGCAAGQICLDTPDCAEGQCLGGVCTLGACDDLMLNLDETDIDCGGSCPACALGLACVDNADCAEGACVGNVCTMVECLSDAECDGQDNECSDASCDLGTYTCVGAPINEGGDCDDANLCTLTSTCGDGACVAGDPVDCSALNGACAMGTCNPDDGSCVATPANEGMACDDMNACTAASSCLAGKCGDPQKLGYVLNEDFSDNMAGWVLDPPSWKIGPAVAGCGDPGTDHTPTMDNGVAGVVLGGCAPAGNNINTFFCMTSPKLDTTGLAKVFLNYWRDLYSDYTPFQKNKIEVWDGMKWVIVFETGGFPETNDAQWTKFSYDISPQTNKDLQVRFCYSAAAGAFQRGSWNVDDVVIGETNVCAP